MRLVIVCSIILMLTAIAVSGQTLSDQEREALCKRVACRDATTVKLKVTDKEYAEFEFPRSPFVADGFINLLSGEHFSVEFDEQDGKLINPRLVKENIHPDHTLNVSFSQNDKNGMVLEVSNPFPTAITYVCRIQHYQQSNLSSTRGNTVSARSSSYEAWPFPISQVLISNVRFQLAVGGFGPGNNLTGSKARILSKPEPDLTEAERPQFPITIVLRAVFTRDAMVTSVKFFKVTPEDAPKDLVTLLTERAIAATKQIKFKPATKDGHPVSMYMQLEYKFDPATGDPNPATKSPKSPATKKSEHEDQVPGV